MISEELLNAVIGAPAYEITEYANQVSYQLALTEDFPENGVKINTHELAHECKKWAYANDYFIESLYGKNIDTPNSCRAVVFNGNDELERAYGATEPEAIFLACQWVLDQK